MSIKKSGRTNGFSREQIKTIRKFNYRVNDRINNPLNVQECPICVQGFDEQKKIRKLRCNHIFHSKCIKPWLKKNRDCPYCKVPFEL